MRANGTYVGLESFEGSVAGLEGAFNFVHSASTSGAGRAAEYFRQEHKRAEPLIMGVVGQTVTGHLRQCPVYGFRTL